MVNYLGNVTSGKGNKYTIKIYNDNYTGRPIELTITNITITRGNSGVFDHIISSGCRIEFINNLQLSQLADLFNIFEKTYRLEVTTNDSNTVVLFNGWLAVDLIEKGLNYQPVITLEFVDYLKKLDESESELINSDVVNVGQLLSNCLDKTAIHQPIIYNTSIHSNNTTLSNTTNYFKDNFIDTNNLLNETERDNAKDTINKLLTPFCSYLYSWDDKYELQNHIDIANSPTRNWLAYSGDGTYIPYGCQQLAMVEGIDFDCHTDGNLTYESGIKQYRLNLKQKLYNNLIYNNFSTYYIIGNTFPNITTGKWGVNLNGDLATNFTVGTSYYDINTYYKYDNQALFTHQNAHYTTIYNFNYMVGKKFKITLDKGQNAQNQITVKAKVGKFKNITYNANQVYSLNYMIKIQGGVNDGKFIGVNSMGKAVIIVPSTENRLQWYRSATGSYKDYQQTIEVTDTLDINNLVDVNEDGLSGDSLFGNENDVTLIIYFTSYFLLNKAGDLTGIQGTQIVGNIEAKYTSNIEDNTLIGSIGGNFTKKLDTSIYFFDTNNCNYSNTILYYDGSEFQRTTGWARDNITDSYKPLAKRLIGDVFSFYAKTRKKISISIWTSKQIKPLTILTFDNIEGSFFVTKLDHDLSNDTYKIEGYELNYEEINIA